MTTLAIMKARIADELARDDLTSQIAYAITDSITAYEDERFFFNESRANTFATVALQEFYTSSDAAFIASIIKFDYVRLFVGDQPYALTAYMPEMMEDLSTNGTSTGIPWAYCWYNNAIRLYPVPEDVRTVRVGAVVKVAAPASDAEASNAWMTHGERLIRSRAKLELALHVLKDSDLAQTMAEGVNEAFDQLKGRTARLTMVGQARIRAMEF